MTNVPRETVPVRLTPDGRVVARILHGLPRPWVAICGGDDGLVLEVETYDDQTAAGWRAFKVEPNAASGWTRRSTRPWREVRAATLGDGDVPRETSEQ